MRLRKRVALYLRVSTSEQTTKNQRRELVAVAKRQGWQVAAVFEDAGVSGAKGRNGRPGLDALMKAVTRRETDMVAAWSVDRLGRSLTDLLEFLKEIHAKGVDLFLHQQGLDTSTPSGRAMFQMMGVFAEFERAMIRERVLAGLHELIYRHVADVVGQGQLIRDQRQPAGRTFPFCAGPPPLTARSWQALLSPSRQGALASGPHSRSRSPLPARADAHRRACSGRRRRRLGHFRSRRLRGIAGRRCSPVCRPLPRA
jgi:Resolvase, N terminal domain